MLDSGWPQSGMAHTGMSEHWKGSAMGSTGSPNNTVHHAWDPGISSVIPARLRPAITLFRPENAHEGYAAVKEAADFCGLKPFELASLKTSRLLIHELLVRVTADLSVPDGPDYEYLGLSLRSMVRCLEEDHLRAHLPELERQFEIYRGRIHQRIAAILDADLYQVERSDNPAERSGKKGWWPFSRTREVDRSDRGEPARLSEEHALTRWKEAAADKNASEDGGIHEALLRITEGIITQHGRLVAARDLLTDLVLRYFINKHGQREIRRLIAPGFTAAVAAAGYRLLPIQDKLIVMNTKGASAAGKSTIRPAQRRLAESLGVPWSDFALVSPDYWRKYLLDYDSLGDDYKYAAMLTGEELAIIDKKLDDYMAEKAERKAMPHLLLDRFRFDSFLIDSEGDYQSTLLSRFGDTVFLFFVITSPVQTVERAWQRGLSTQRYKAVDDLLYHNIEAFKGIPEIFFSWTAIKDKTIHFEFLDNDVPLGQLPRTIAYGVNDRMTILDPLALDRIDRFREVNVDATGPDDVLKPASGSRHDFLHQCINTIPYIDWVTHDTARLYGQIEKGRWITCRRDVAPAELLDDPKAAPAPGCLASLGWPSLSEKEDIPSRPIDLEAARQYTLGRWGEALKKG
ncbi:hypothetical protein AB8880_11160 [Alphaproteobacteria bacterium LSUCC0684]